MITGLPAIVFSPPLMCDDIHATLAELRDKGADVARDVSDQGWVCWWPPACRMDLSCRSTSPGTRRRHGPDDGSRRLSG